jgi:hypothetical protein
MKRLLRLLLVSLFLIPGAYLSSETGSVPSRTHASNSVTVEFAYTGQNATFTVPPGVNSLSVGVFGAQGGIADIFPYGVAGEGGFLAVNVPVSTGEVFKIVVGGQGTGLSFNPAKGAEFPGGWPDGGTGRNHVDASNGPSGYGTGGGGSSAIYKVVNGADALIAVSGGGGGQSNGYGGAGGLAGGNASSDPTPFDLIREGTGGSSTAGGVGACFDDGNDAPAISLACSGDGASFLGGSAHPQHGGSGGGGGYFGGGAGIAKSEGGGGSSWWDSSLGTKTEDLTGVREGNGVIRITYTLLAMCQPGTYSASGFVPCTPASIGFFVADIGATSQMACPPQRTTSSTGSSECGVVLVATTTSTIAPTTSIPVVTTTIPAVATTSQRCTTRSGRTITRACLLRNAQLVVPSTTKVVPKVARSSARTCKVIGTAVRAIRKGSCSVSLTVTPRGKKSKTHRVTVSVLS